MSFFDDASWVLIPEGIKEDVVYAQKPTNGTGDLTFTRASDATRTNSAGVIERTPWNLVQQSETFSQSPWNLSRTSAFGSGSIANTTTAPNGTLTADYIQQASGQTLSGGAFIFLPYTAGQSYTLSVYAKKAENNYLRLGFAIGTAGVGLFGNFDLNTGVPGTPDAGITQTIQDVGNGWYRCSITATSQVTISAGTTFVYQSSTFNSSVTTPLQGIYIWGAQLVEGTDAKPYFATTNRQDVPRLDYRNADGSLSTCPRLLLEPQRTNLVPNGVLFNSSTGVSYDSTVTASPAPGVQNATRITKNEAAGNVRYTNQNASATLLAGSSVYTLSRYFKYDGFDFQTTMEYNNANNWGGVSWTVPINISATAITIGTPSACTATIVNMGSGWYRVTATITTGAIPVGFPTYLMRLPSTLSTGQGFLTALPQLELGAYATTFIPTTTAAVTRIFDLASKTGVSSLIGQTEGTLFLDFESGANDGVNNTFSINNGSVNRIIIRKTSSNTIDTQVRVAAVTQALIATSAITVNTRYKCAVGYKENDIVFYVNGVQIGVDTSSTIPACSIISNDAGSSIEPMYRPINQAALFPTRLTNAQLAQLTTL